jgi:hypothetical protein
MGATSNWWQGHFYATEAVAGMSLVGTPQLEVICTSQEEWEPQLSRCALAHGPRSYCQQSTNREADNQNRMIMSF